jgi:PKD repeat protein
MDRRINGWYIAGITCVCILILGFFSCDISSPLLMAIEDAVIAYNKPVADFSVSPKSGPAPLTVYFTDKSEGDITSWEWDFGDGGNATIRNPSHKFVDEKVYPVRLTVSGPGGTDTKEELIYALSDIFPIVAITSPKDGQFVKGDTIAVNVSAHTAIDNVPLKEITLSVNSGPPEIIPVSGIEIDDATFNWILPDDEVYTLTAIAFNESDRESDPYTISVTVDKTPPTIGELTFNGEPPLKLNYVNSKVTIGGSAEDLNISSVILRINKTEIKIKPPFNPFSYIWDALSIKFGEGRYDISAIVYDKAGNTASTPTYSVLVDNTPPKGTFTIYGGLKDPELTRSIKVILLSDISDERYGSGVANMRFRNEYRENPWSDWTPYKKEYEWTLNDIEGERVVLAEFIDRTGNVVLLKDTIMYDSSGIIIRP